MSPYPTSPKQLSQIRGATTIRGMARGGAVPASWGRALPRSQPTKPQWLVLGADAAKRFRSVRILNIPYILQVIKNIS